MQSPTPDPRPPTRFRRAVALTLAVLALASAALAQSPTTVIDDFEGPNAWTAHPSDGVTLEIGRDSGARGGHAMRLDFDFHGGGGYALARRAVNLTLPANYEFTFQLRGDAPVENLEFKLIDSTGDNVWWSNQRDYSFPRRWTQVTRKKRHIGFAWGPVGGGEIRRVAAIEIVVTAGSGGKGTVWVDDLALTPLDTVANTRQPVVSASSSAMGFPYANAVDGDTSTAWRSLLRDHDGSLLQWLTLDFGGRREYGGIVVDWDPLDYATSFAVETSNDGKQWETRRTITRFRGGRSYLDLPEGDSRYLRLHMLKSARCRGFAVREITVQPLAWSESGNAFMRAVARDAPRGTYPRYLTDSAQSYWTLVGVSGDEHEGLLSEDGALESQRGGYSVEPFLRDGDTLVTWANVDHSQSLEKGYLPIPSASWTRGPLALEVTAFGNGSAERSILYTRYRITNRLASPHQVTLYLVVRPFQVNPPWQFLNSPGGVARVDEIVITGRQITVIAQGGRERQLLSLTTPTAGGASTLDQGEIVTMLRRGELPKSPLGDDRTSGRASAAFAYRLDLPAGESRDVYLALLPLANDSVRFARWYMAGAGTAGDSIGRAHAERALAASRAAWGSLLGGVSVTLPPSAARVSESLRTTLGYILINRNGPAIQPGSRSYMRSWIRDGSLTSAALLRLGRADDVKRFIEWFAPYQYPSGKVPCCVDARGADPVPENDSHGELVFLVTEYYRYTRDRALAERMWPHVVKAVAYMDSLRHSRMTPEYDAPDKRAFHGLLPQSISHEGYSAKPMHSYWDDFFALKGFKDATDLAAALGHDAERARFATIRDEFRRDLYASLDRAMSERKIDFIPGSVELGDFDATSTTIAVEPAGEIANLPAAALRRTFDRYYADVAARRAGTKTWDAYTPYELRTVGTFVRMGQRARADTLLQGFMGDQRPPAWHEWAEVVWHDPRAPKFVGDMPHTWVGSDFVRSTLDMFAYDREADSALVVGAGVPSRWTTEAPGVSVRGLRTVYGALDLAMRAERDSVVRVHVGAMERVPRGGVVVRPPLARPVRSVTVNGAAAAATRDAASGEAEVVVRRLPADVAFRY
ncbi:MAG TPA: discoidin domain-containing protein [Gemmatimonadaceae bacterium]|nr:discoidin domain-containing protein [Gemmatimonadaceae bacterium]